MRISSRTSQAWRRPLSPSLGEPGVVRTDETLARHLLAEAALARRQSDQVGFDAHLLEDLPGL
jgi:hypothetical protein